MRIPHTVYVIRRPHPIHADEGPQYYYEGPFGTRDSGRAQFTSLRDRADLFENWKYASERARSLVRAGHGPCIVISQPFGGAR
jgi:hypothetical protein